MSEQLGEKTEEPTQRKIDDALSKGQFPRSQEVQTVFVLMGGLSSLYLLGGNMWHQMADAFSMCLGHLHDTPIGGPELSVSPSGYARSNF